MMDNKSNITLSIFLLFVSLFALISNNGVDGSHQEYPEYYHNLHHNVEVKAVHKTGYHFQPPKNWINDPNGPMYYKGLYHLFYQYNPKAAIWGNIVWAHSVSKDLINWEALEPAIESTEFFDMNGCWSGSATMVQGGNPVILYTGRNPQLYNVQNYAIPANLSDPYLRKWIKPDDNPLIEPTQMINHTSFRDPTTAWFVDGRWKIALGSQHDDRGIAYLYTSKDFKHWVKADHPLHTKEGTGNWECPDFYPVSLSGQDGLDTSVYGPDVKHVFKVSLDKTRYEYYTIGTYDRQKDRYIPDEGQVDGWAGLRYDYGNFYASKSFYDPVKSRRILWAWVNESDFMENPNKPLNDITKGWAGIQTIPRKVWADPSGKQLLQWPVEELETLRGQSVELTNVKLSEGDHFQVQGISAAQADVDVTFSFASLDRAEPLDPNWNNENAWDLCHNKGAWNKGGLGPFGLKTLASLNLKEYTPVFFRIYKVATGYKALMCSDATRSSKSPGLYRPIFGGLVDVDLSNKTLSIRSLIDNSVVESFGAGGKIVITSRVYPKYAVSKDAHLFVFNNGKESINIDRLNGWSMNKPVMNEPVKH